MHCENMDRPFFKSTKLGSLMFKMTREENIEFAKRMIVDSIWKEANIEGISATFPQTQEIYEGRTVAGLGVEETVAINNLKHAWWKLIDEIDEPLSSEFVKSMNKEIGGGIIRNAGQLRDFSALISGCNYRPPLPSEESLTEAIEHIEKIENPEKKGLSTFCILAKQQFFPDGNKRTAQLVSNKVLIEHGAGILSVPVEKKLEFGEQLIAYYESDDMETLMKFLATNCLSGMEFDDR